MAATFEWHVEFLQTDPNDDNFIKFISCGIYGTENGVTKKTMWKVPFSGKKSDIPVEDWKNYSDLMEGSGEEILISWCKNAIGSEQVATLEDRVQGYINVHTTQPVYHNEAPSKFSTLPKVT